MVEFSLKDIKMNQNVLVMIIGFIALAYSEQYNLTYLFYISLFVSTLMAISVVFSMIAYTINYMYKKLRG